MRKVAELLRDQSRCHYPEAQVTLLPDAEATTAGILRSAGTRDPGAAGGGEGAAVSRPLPRFEALLLLLGPRLLDPGKGSTAGQYLCPFQFDDSTNESLIGTAISGNQLQEALDGVGASHLTVVLDCCHAGGVKVSKDRLAGSAAARGGTGGGGPE